MIIDIHTHCFPDKIAARALQKLSEAACIPPCADGTASGLSASTRAAGIDLSVVLPVATGAGQVASINEFAAQLNEHTAETGLFSLGGAHPDDPDWREHLKRAADLGLKGIKLHPVYQGVDFDDPRYVRLLSYAGELGLVVITHAGYDIGFPGVAHCSPAMVRNALRQAGPVKLVLAHMGGWQQWDEVEALLTEAPVYLDTAFSTGMITPLRDGRFTPEELHLLDQERFLRMVRAFGTDRVLFGTDSPWSDQKESLEWIRALPLTDAEKAAILGGNAVKWLGRDIP